jgi:integrase
MASNQTKRRRHRRSFGAIRQLKSGNFQASYKDLNGLIQRAPQTFATREAADQFIAVKQADLIAEREAQKSGRWLLDANRGAITLGEYLSRYMHAKQDWSERTRELNERLAARWIMEAVEGHCLADKRLDAISPFMVREWFAAVQRSTHESALQARTPKPLNESAAAKRWASQNGQKVEPLGKASRSLIDQWKAAGAPQLRTLEVSADYSPAGRSTAKQVYSLLKSVFNAAIYDELIERNPAKDKTATIVRSRPSKVATIEQIEALSQAVPARYRVAVLLAAYTGLRQGELFGLARKHFNAKTNTITVERSVKRLQGKPAYIGKTKTAGSVRTVELPLQITRELEQHLKSYGVTDDEALIFTTGGGKLMTSSELCSWFIPARDRVGMSGFKWHWLRSTGATIAASTGASLPALMNRLGHTSVRAAMIYQKLNANDDARIAAGIESQLASAKIYALDDFREATA